MKHYILLSLSGPAIGTEKYFEWTDLAKRLRASAEAQSGIAPLGEATWLIPRDTGVPFLAECISAASTEGFEHRLWFLDESA